MKALIAMSGGVDSSVCALIMKNQGFECIGCCMNLHNPWLYGSNDNNTSGCCTDKDIEDARMVAQKLNMEFVLADYHEDFKEKVIDKFVNCYLCGNTPNPCIDCNNNLKFGRLHEKAKELKCDYLVTGHYARIEEYDGIFHLKESRDISKDQSYVLYRMTQKQLSSTLFPLGDMENKDETRRLADDFDLINANKKDSQDICFVPDGDYASFIERITSKKQLPGKFVLKDGTVIGEHKGIIHYTIGQRKGLGIAWTEPLYVCRICLEENVVILGSNKDLYTRELLARDVNWISGKPPLNEFRATVRTRYHGKKNPALIIPFSGNEFKVIFDEAVRAVTPGQAAVIYMDEELIGGGIIASDGKNY